MAAPVETQDETFKRLEAKDKMNAEELECIQVLAVREYLRRKELELIKAHDMEVSNETSFTCSYTDGE